jgi:two-component system, OmpR family, response regulator
VNQPREMRARVLVVDDDLGIRTLLGAALQLHGYECETVPDGKGAIQALSRGGWDAVLLDLLLPQTNGFEVIQFIKANRPEMMKRTIVMTAAQQKTLRDFSDGPQLWRVFFKPFDLRELLDEIGCCVTSQDPRFGAAWRDARVLPSA